MKDTLFVRINLLIILFWLWGFSTLMIFNGLTDVTGSRESAPPAKSVACGPVAPSPESGAKPVSSMP